MNFTPNNIYHIYNRGNNSQAVFLDRDNYLFFLNKIRKHLYPLVNILAYCLMPNHFHLMVYVSNKHSRGDLKSPRELDPFIINNAIAVILRSYTRAINKKHNRTGSLFQEQTKAKKLSKNNHSFVCYHYIHQNPVKARLVKNMEDWEFSSYRDYMVLRKGTLCNKKLAAELLDIPLDLNQFMKQSNSVIIDEKTRSIIF